MNSQLKFPEDIRTTLVFTLSDQVGGLAKALKIFANHNVNLTKIDSRPSRTPNTYDFCVDVAASESDKSLSECLVELKENYGDIQVFGHSKEEAPWFPRHISDLDKFSNKVLSCGEELSSDHPGFSDQIYRARRQEITQIAQQYKFGDKIPTVKYTEEEIATWKKVYNKLTSLYKTNACSQHNHVLPLLEQNCGYGPDNIPQLEDISKFLKRCTGWTLRPVTGLLTSRDFLNGLAFRVFHSTQYIRHHSCPFYTPEPDVCHELLGHVPLFADKAFADFSQEIGLASLGASEEDIEKLATCYWFTVEFGLCKQKEGVKAYGAGLLSSFGELEYCLSDKPELRPFDPFKACTQKYPITEYQPVYYVAGSFEEAKRQMIRFAASMDRPFAVWYNETTETVEVVDSKKKLLEVCQAAQHNLISLYHALECIEFSSMSRS